MGTLSKRSREVQDNSSDSEEDNYDETEKLASSEREEVDKLVEEGEEGEEEEEDSYDETEKLASSEGEEEEELVEDAEEEDHKEGDGYGPEDDEMAELEKEYMGLRHQEQDLLKNLKRYKEEDLLKGQAVKN